ncbi:N6-adenosine-methyltransferase catalytic subunit [Nymphon striatum]|nr:N6-adenosine-methyltransferase catalytic subunit [Nymphon striatum]
MSDTWREIQAFKSKHGNLRERLHKRRKEREDLGLCLTPSGSDSKLDNTSSSVTAKNDTSSDNSKEDSIDNQIEIHLISYLCDVSLQFPLQSKVIKNVLSKQLDADILQSNVDNLLQKFAAQDLISIQNELSSNENNVITVISTEHTKLLAVVHTLSAKNSSPDEDTIKKKRKRNENEDSNRAKEVKTETANESPHKERETVESLLSMPSIREKEIKKVGEEILDLLSKPTAKEKSLVEKFKSQGGGQVKEFCPHGTKIECMKIPGTVAPCGKLHFKKIIQGHTDESLGDCSFLNTCFHMDTCKVYVHYEVDYSLSDKQNVNKQDAKLSNRNNASVTLYPAQWVQSDLRYFDMSILGKFSVIMADPPWDIHMELPYGTMSDDEMRQLNVPCLQDDGLIFLWVTGRAMELGRECLNLWGYERCDELIWVKTNQLQRIIRTGRTGHWLNHGKEHCLVGIKGNPTNINRGLDCDVIVAEVRATSHKPDEIYGIIERLAPGSRKIELFGRPHNIQPNWITLGNQVDGVKLLDPDLVKVIQERYPDGTCMGKK